MGDDGTLEVNVIAWLPGGDGGPDPLAASIEKLWCTSGAAERLVPPAWFASMTQAPTPVSETVGPVMEQAPDVEVPSMEKVTGFPESPPVAETV